MQDVAESIWKSILLLMIRLECSDNGYYRLEGSSDLPDAEMKEIEESSRRIWLRLQRGVTLDAEEQN